MIYWPALDGPPISDDFRFLLNPWVTNPAPENLLALLDPRSEATRSLANYAPVRPLVNTLQWWLHPQLSIAYHVLNLFLHCVVTVLLSVFLRSVGVSPAAAVLSGAFFLVQPANVEAVAWMSQVWSPLALAFSLLALLALARRPLAATLWLALALLTKPLAVFSVPAAAAFAWSRTDLRPRTESEPQTPPRWRWIAAWAMLVLLFTIAQLMAYGDTGPRQRLDEDPAVAFRSMATYALRYLLMASSSWGVSAFHEPPLSLSWSDPWLLAAAVVLLLLGARLVVTLRRRSPEAAGWIWVLAAFAPVSQIYPFLYPMSDRYLYFMLPGLLLAACFAGGDLLTRLPSERARGLARQGLVAATLLVCILFGLRSAERARIWRSEDAVMADAARHYPGGVSDLFLRARRAASEGDVATAETLLRRASARGWDFWNVLLKQPAFEPIRGERRFKALLADLAAAQIEKLERQPRLSQAELRNLADAHAVRGETEAALAALDTAIARGGPFDESLRERRNELARTASPR